MLSYSINMQQPQALNLNWTGMSQPMLSLLWLNTDLRLHQLTILVHGRKTNFKVVGTLIMHIIHTQGEYLRLVTSQSFETLCPLNKV